jgi:hypothetical protein
MSVLSGTMDRRDFRLSCRLMGINEVERQLHGTPKMIDRPNGTYLLLIYSYRALKYWATFIAAWRKFCLVR